MIGQTISHYKITEKLGEGGMGVVYKARDTKLDRVVALKFLPQHLTSSEEDKLRFIREAKAAAALNHPNICTIHNIDEHEDNQFIVMEYIEGETLRTKIDAGDLTLDTTLDYANRIADALSEAHQNDIIHRDIKPENIMVNADGHIKVMDFGLAKLKHTHDITKTGSTVGTLAYMSPEQIQGKEVDHRSDLFSLGIVIYEMLTGSKPFRGEHEAATTYAIVNEDPAPIQRSLPEVPDELVKFFDKILAKEPEERIGSAAEAKDQLENIKDLSGDFSKQSPPVESESKSKSQDNSSSTTFTITVPNFGFGKKSIGKVGLIASVIGLLAIVLFIGWWFVGLREIDNNTTAQPEGHESKIADHSIAVLPFEVTGSGAEEWKDGMVTTLSLNLDGAAGLRAIPDRTIFAKLNQKGRTEELGMNKALDIARDIGAHYVVIGSSVQLGKDLRFGVEIREAASGERLGQVEVRGDPDSVTELTNKLSSQILGVLLERSEEAIPSVNLESITTESLPALKAFLAGEQNYRAGDYEKAEANYETAIEHDTTFALAYLRLSWSRGWGPGNVNQPLNKSYRLSDQLPLRERRLVRARYMRFVQENPIIAADSLRKLTEDYPDDPQIWDQFADALFHNPVPPGWPGAEDAFGRAIELDPGNASSHHHYIELAFALHHDSTLAAKRINALPIDDIKKRHYSLSLDLIFGNKKQKERALKLLEVITLPDFSGFTTIFNHPLHWHLQDRLYRTLQNRENIEDDAFAYNLAMSSYQQGHLHQSIRKFEQLEIDISTYLAYKNSLGLPIPDSIAHKFLEPMNVSNDPSLNKLKASVIYLIDQGKREDANELISKIQNVSDSTENQNPLSDIDLVINELKGYRAWKSGNLKVAEKLLSHSNNSFSTGGIWRGDFFRELNNLDKAEDWYLVAWVEPLAHERLGALYEEMNKPEKAAAAYRRFIEAWKDADPELQNRVEKARQQLQQLTVSKGHILGSNKY